MKSGESEHSLNPNNGRLQTENSSKGTPEKWEYPLGTRTHIIFNDIAQFQHHKKERMES